MSSIMSVAACSKCLGVGNSCASSPPVIHHSRTACARSSSASPKHTFALWRARTLVHDAPGDRGTLQAIETGWAEGIRAG